MNHLNRRSFLKTACAGAAGIGFATRSFAEETPNPWHGLKIGLASYSVNKMSFDEMVALVKDLGIKYVSIKECHLSLNSTKEQCQTAAQKLKDAGITLISCGVIYLKGDEAAFRKSFEYVKNTGAPTMVMSCNPGELITVEKLASD